MGGRDVRLGDQHLHEHTSRFALTLPELAGEIGRSAASLLQLDNASASCGERFNNRDNPHIFRDTLARILVASRSQVDAVAAHAVLRARVYLPRNVFDD